jgi:predicted enzyme related to lactoylglutathione lyase
VRSRNVRGLATINLGARDVREAARWYGEVFGVEPWLVSPSAEAPTYVQFRVGEAQDEVGIVDRRFLGGGNAVADSLPAVYWHVDDVPAALARLIAHGAVEHDHCTHHHSGLVTGAVLDPFGNLLGVMHDPAFSARASAS